MKINVDVNGKYEPTDRSWQFGIGNDHAFQLLRKDVIEHLKLAHDKLGIKYVRFHGLFDDDMQVFQSLSDLNVFRILPCADKISEISFKQIANVFDNILGIGMKPFVELSFMPSALASGNKTGLAYKANITMPKDLNAWAEFIKQFVIFCENRYGQDEVRSWYFEVWNEPDLGIFFAGSKEDYFQLYRTTTNAIKSVDAKLKVGGPATSACKWIADFLQYCKQNDVPCDFVTSHHYPGDAFGNDIGSKDVSFLIKTAQNCADKGIDMGDTLVSLFYDSKTLASRKKGEFVQMEDDAVIQSGDLPLMITEWNSSSVNPAPIHDEKYSAAFVIKSVMDKNPKIPAFMFWCCTDVFEEIFNLNKPFHGSFGIVSNDGIPKPNFWAFWILSKLYDQRLALPTVDGKVAYAVFADGTRKQILLYAQDFNPDSNERFDIEICINAKAQKVQCIRIDDKHCNPKAIWQKMGAPDLLSKEQVEYIKKRSKPAISNYPYAVGEDNTHINLQMRSNDVVLLQTE